MLNEDNPETEKMSADGSELRNGYASCRLPEKENKDKKTEEIKYVMPDLSKGSAAFYDTNSFNFWCGIPLDRVDPLTAIVTLDKVKMDLLGFYSKMIQDKQKAKIIVPQKSGIREMINGITGKFRRG